MNKEHYRALGVYDATIGNKPAWTGDGSWQGRAYAEGYYSINQPEKSPERPTTLVKGFPDAPVIQRSREAERLMRKADAILSRHHRRTHLGTLRKQPTPAGGRHQNAASAWRKSHDLD